MHPVQYIHLIIMGILLILTILYFSRSILVTKTRDKNYFFAVVGLFGITFTFSQFMLTLDESDLTLLIFHKIKLASTYIVFYANIRLIEEIIGRRTKLTTIFKWVGILFLLTMPFPIFTTLPIESVRVFKWSFFVKYHFATPGPAYSFYGIFVLAIYLPALIIYNRGQVSRFERVIIFFIIIPVIITSINDFAVTHHLIKNIMLTEFSILFTIFAVLLKLYREEQINHIKLELLSEKLQKEVEERTKEISNKNQLIMDSIAYSRKIQKNILPSLDKVGEYFHDYLLIWRQKDIVGGDLFWVNTTEKCLFWAVIDCTGHGVPGALMTFMVKTELNSILQNVLIDEPADILKHLNTELKNLLNQEGLGKEIASSGLDLTVCGHRRGSEYVKIASANQHYWLQGAGGTKVVRGDRMSLGYPDSPADYPFTTTEVNIRDYNRIFCMTDGYYTQLGEASTYQFGRKRVTQMIEENYRTPLHELFDFFKEEYDTYRNTTPQTDDITVFAVDMASYLK